MPTITVSQATREALKLRAKSLGMSTRTAAELILSQALSLQPFQDAKNIDPAEALTAGIPGNDIQIVKDKLRGENAFWCPNFFGYGKANQMRAAKALRALGWSPVAVSDQGTRQRVWVAPGYRIENGKAVRVDAEAAV